MRMWGGAESRIADRCTRPSVLVASSANCSRQMADRTVGSDSILLMPRAHWGEQEGQSRLAKTLWALVM